MRVLARATALAAASLAGLAVAMPAAVAVEDTRLNGELMRLDPETRLEQTCDTEVMLRINREKKSYTADKVIAYTFGETIFRDDTMEAPGAVFRSHGDWYHLSYTCVTGPRHLEARQLDYRIGDVVPRAAWADYNLYD